MPEKRALGLVLAVCLSFQVNLLGQTLSPTLAPLAPLLDKTWVGLMSAPDGSAEWEVVCRYSVLWGGTAVRYTRTIAALQSVEEGTLYWDDVADKVAFFIIHSSGVFSSGFLAVYKNVITFEGKMTWPAPPPDAAVKQAFDFRNTFELVSESEMVDRWFQNASGSWRPGHMITFSAQRTSSAGRALPVS